MGWSYFGSENDTWETFLFIVFAVINTVCFIPSMQMCMSQPLTVSTWAIPVLCVLILFLNVLLALGSNIGEYNWITHVGTVAFTIVMPLFLVSVFEMAYKVHKSRSVKFCGIEFDQGHRINTEPCSWFLRNAVRICALALFILGLVVDFQPFGLHDPTSGSSGFVDAGDGSAQFILSLIPALVLSAISIYLSVYMWRYGNNASMVVNSTVFNRWAFLFIGSVCMFAGIIPSEPYFRLTSSFGITILLASVVIVLKEVQREDRVRADFAAFLESENTNRSNPNPNTHVHRSAKSLDEIPTVSPANLSAKPAAEKTNLVETRSWPNVNPGMNMISRAKYTESDIPKQFVRKISSDGTVNMPRFSQQSAPPTLDSFQFFRINATAK